MALTGLLAASCSSAVVPMPYGAPALRAPSLVPPAAGALATDPPSYDAAPHQPETSGQIEIADDIAPPRPAPSAAPAAPPSAALPPVKASLGPLAFISQTLNNCGPASIAELLAFWGIDRGQAEVQSVLRGDGNPYGMTPAGVPSYMASLGIDSVLGTAGSDDLIKQLIRAGFPVIVNQTVSDTDLEFHYRPIQGYDDERGVFVASDPLLGPRYAIDYAQFDRAWAYTGHRFMVLYPPDKAPAVTAALAAGKWDSAFAEGGTRAQSASVPGSAGPPPVTTPTVTTVTGKAAAVPNWYSGPVTVTFKATDQSGFGVANTSYAIDNQPVQLYRGEFIIKDPGKHTVTFHSVNFSGSREADQKLEVDIDQTPPVTTATVDGARDPSGAYKSPAKLILTATDDGSGVAKTTCSIDGGPPQAYTAPVPLSVGGHTIGCSSVDQAGNQETTKVLAAAVLPVAAVSFAASPAAAQPSYAASPATSAAPPAPSTGYQVCAQYDQTKPFAPGTPVALKLRLCDLSGKNLSSAAVPLTLQYVIGPSTAKPELPSPFRFNPALAGYQADEPAGLPSGSYSVFFTAAGDPSAHQVQFRIG